MNRVFRTKWSVAHQTYVVTDEHHAAKGKAGKSAVALAVSALLLAVAGSASAAYLPGYMSPALGDYVGAQTRAHETAEYQADWGLKAMNASTAYALGYTGKGVGVAVMDSGALLSHSELSGTRFEAVEHSGQYGSSGNHYQQGADGVGDVFGNGAYEAGKDFKIDGNFIAGQNDTHGTHVTGTVAANKDGQGMHGVAYNATVFVGNSGATDNNNYGPFQDYNFYYEGWSALADKLVEKNGKLADGKTNRGGFINNSFGTNIRYKADGSSLPVNTTLESEFEYFLFQKNPSVGDKDFVDAAWDAIKGDKNVVQIFTTGNRDMKNPYYRPLYPYFNPEAEDQWIAVTGLKKLNTLDANGNPKYDYWYGVNKAGDAKWWTVAAPGASIYSSVVYDDHYMATDAQHPMGSAGYATFGGTSMAAPHVAGAMAVLMERYPNMTAPQVREVMFTTANHKNSDGSNFDSWSVKDGEVDPLFGWGVPDLAKGMFGPGQFLGHFTYQIAKGGLDVWSNDISQIAFEQRKAEDQKWLDSIKECLNAGQTQVVESQVKADGAIRSQGDIPGLENDKITEAEARQWRIDYYKKRVKDINDRKAETASLTKTGEGTLVLLGNNTYEGPTTVAGGTLLAFAESIGHVAPKPATDAKAATTGTDPEVLVKNGGTFGVLSSYDDKFTQRGHVESKEATDGKLTITIEDGGTLYVDAASHVVVKKVDFKNQNKKNVVVGLAGADRQGLIDTYTGKKDAITGSFESKEGDKLFEGIQANKLAVQSAFFELGDVKGSGNKIITSMTKKKDVTFATFAKGGNQTSIANAIEASGNALMGDILTKDKAEIESVYAGLDDDFYVTARNALVMNSTAVTRSVLEQAQGMGEGRAAELDEGRARIWATGMGLWGNADGNAQSLDVDFRVGMIGGEVVATDTTKVGAFFGYGGTDYSGVQGKIDADDTHYGIYAMSDIGNVTLTYGLAYTDEDRDTVRYLGGTPSKHSENASVLQGFAEAGYNFQAAAAKVTPYVGFTWARVETDDVKDRAFGHVFKTEGVKDDLQIATLGVRTALPFNWGTLPIALKADAGWSHFFGDTDGVASVQMGADGKFASIEGSELKDQFNIGLGVVGKVAKHATVGVSYTGAWASDMDNHGIMANVRVNF